MKIEAEVSHLDWRNIVKASEDTGKDILAALDDYFQPFAEPAFMEPRGDEGERPMLCLKCGEPLNGFLSMFMGNGGFEWGIAHGEGHCRGCGWPGRAMHYIKDGKGEDVASLRNFILQYHPDFVSRKALAEALEHPSNG